MYIGLCPKLNDPMNGKVVFSGLREGNYANYSCDSGYNLLGSPTIVCLSTGLWNPASPICYSKQQTITTSYILCKCHCMVIL